MKLAEFMAQQTPPMSDRDLAALIPCTDVAVGRYRRGDRIPHEHAMERIIEITKGAVTPNDFYNGPLGANQ